MKITVKIIFAKQRKALDFSLTVVYAFRVDRLQILERTVTGRVPAGALFFSKRRITMSTGKPFFTYTQHLDKLENEKNLIIEDRDYAESVLKRISYFSLITGYKKLYRNPTTRKFKDNTTFEEIVALYQFDENLRLLFLKHLLQFEHAMRSMLSYYFTQKHGEMQSEYLSTLNYNNNPRNANTVVKLISKMRRIATNSTDYTYINHHRNKYGNVPLWVLVKVLTFGNISAMYHCFPNDLQVKISKNYSNVTERELMQHLKVMTQFRNVSAHSERLFSFTTPDDISDTIIHAKLGIAKRGSQYIYGKRDLFSVVIAFRYLLPKEDFREFKTAMDKTIKRFIKQTTNITHDELLHEMGFPQNWKKITAYRV